MAITGNRYDKDFKLGAVKMVLEKGQKTSSVVTDLGISYDTLPVVGNFVSNFSNL
jgi:transposase-like protein